jgi:acyl-CoA thioesterase-1
LRHLIFLLVSILGLIALPASATTVLVLGDSISAAYGLDRVEDGWVNLLQSKLSAQNVRVENASISGDTTRGGLERLPGLLEEFHPDLLLIELGGNDGLRGLTPQQMKANLLAMIQLAERKQTRCVLLGMKIPPNYGKAFAERFESVYGDVAQQTKVTLLPFLLQGVGGVTTYMQLDGIHPNHDAQPIIMNQVYNTILPLLMPTRSSARSQKHP